MDKKLFLGFLVTTGFLLLFAGCANQTENKTVETTNAIEATTTIEAVATTKTTTTTIAVTTTSAPIALSDVQINACNSAGDNKNCAKLEDLELVTAAECCKYMNKCC